MSLRKMFLSFLLVSTFVIYTGCDSSNSPAAAAGDTSVDTNYLTLEDVKPATGETKYSYKLEKGDKFTYKIATINNVFQEMKLDSLMSQKVDYLNTLLIDFEVKDVDKDTIAEVEVTIQHITVVSDIDGKKTEYKTGDKLDSIKIRQFGLNEAISGKPFFARIDKDGKIREVFRVDKIVDAWLAQQKDTVAVLQKDAIGEEIKMSLVNMISQVFRSFSKGSLKANEAHREEKPGMQDQTGMYKLSTTLFYTLKEKGKYKGNNISMIDAGYEGKYDFSPNLAKEGIKVETSSLTGSGKVFFNDDLGKLEKSKTHIAEEIVLRGKVPDQKGKIMDFHRISRTRVVNVVERIK